MPFELQTIISFLRQKKAVVIMSSDKRESPLGAYPLWGKQQSRFIEVMLIKDSLKYIF